MSSCSAVFNQHSGDGGFHSEKECCLSKSGSFISTKNKHLLDETDSNIQFIASGQCNIGRSEADPNIILYGRNQLDVGRGQVQ